MLTFCSADPLHDRLVCVVLLNAGLDIDIRVYVRLHYHVSKCLSDSSVSLWFHKFTLFAQPVLQVCTMTLYSMLSVYNAIVLDA